MSNPNPEACFSMKISSRQLSTDFPMTKKLRRHEDFPMLIKSRTKAPNNEDIPIFVKPREKTAQTDFPFTFQSREK